MRRNSGFTLIELSVVLAIIGVILYGGMSILVVGLQTSQVNSTVATMDAIEKALLDYRVAFGRIPCPSDITATAPSANYGVEAANTGSCTGGSPAANFIAASGTAEGGVPTRTLRLPDSSMYDGWGHRLRYAVNPNYTVTTSTACSLSTNPSITVNDASGAARSTKAMYAVVSHGANGHGAYTSNGVIVNAGSTNADELTNCHCTSTGAASTYTPLYVQKAPTVATAGSPNTAFDDIVAYKEFWQVMSPNLTSNALGCLFPSYYRTVTIDHTKVGTVNNTDQSSFPVLFSGSYSYLATTANGGAVTNANGYDITFTSDAAGQHLLPFERESYNASTGAVVFWVQVPTVSHSADTVIYLQYGNPNITTDQSNKTGTWNTNYKGVWHLAETSGNALDSTSYGTNGTIQGTVTQGAAGLFGNAYGLSGDTSSTNYVVVGNPADQHLDFGSGNSFTVSLWVNVSAISTYFDMVRKGGDTPSNPGYVLFANTDPPLYYGDAVVDTSNTRYYGTQTHQTSGSWYHMAQVLDASMHLLHIYYNGTELTPSISVSSNGFTSSKSLIFGIGNSGDNIAAKMQEIHIVGTAESPDWIKTEYNNQSAPDKATYGASGFYTVGSAVSR